MSDDTAEARGLKFHLLGWKIRVWKYGFEYGNKFGGIVFFFPWSPIFRARKYK